MIQVCFSSPGYLWWSQQWAQIIRVHMVNKIDKICIGQARLQVCLPGCNNLTQSKTLPAKVNSVIIGSAFYNYNLHLITVRMGWVSLQCCRYRSCIPREHNEIQYYKSQASSKPCLQVVKIMFLLRSNVVNYVSKLSLMSQNDRSL